MVFRARQPKQLDTMPLGCYPIPSSVLDSKQNSRTHSRGGQEGAPGDKRQRPQQIFCSLATSLGLCPHGQSRQEPWLHLKATSLDGLLLPNVPLRHENHSGCTLQSPACVEPGKFDPATRTARWHHAEHTHEWMHRWCRYGQILQWNGLNSMLIFIANSSLHKIIILLIFHQSIRPAMSRAQNAITLPHCQKMETNLNYPFNYHFLPHLQPMQHLLHWGPTLVPQILPRPSWSTILDPPKGPPQDH